MATLDGIMDNMFGSENNNSLNFKEILENSPAFEQSINTIIIPDLINKLKSSTKINPLIINFKEEDIAGIKKHLIEKLTKNVEIDKSIANLTKSIGGSLKILSDNFTKVFTDIKLPHKMISFNNPIKLSTTTTTDKSKIDLTPIENILVKQFNEYLPILKNISTTSEIHLDLIGDTLSEILKILFNVDKNKEEISYKLLYPLNQIKELLSKNIELNKNIPNNIDNITKLSIDFSDKIDKLIEAIENIVDINVNNLIKEPNLITNKLNNPSTEVPIEKNKFQSLNEKNEIDVMIAGVTERGESNIIKLFKKLGFGESTSDLVATANTKQSKKFDIKNIDESLITKIAQYGAAAGGGILLTGLVTAFQDGPYKETGKVVAQKIGLPIFSKSIELLYKSFFKVIDLHLAGLATFLQTTLGKLSNFEKYLPNILKSDNLVKFLEKGGLLNWSNNILDSVGKWFGNTFSTIGTFIQKKIIPSSLTAVTEKLGKYLALLGSKLKFIPVIGSLISVGLGIQRMYQGDYLGGILEFVSAIFNFVPSGIGQALSWSISFFLMARDLTTTKEERAKNFGLTSVSQTFDRVSTWIAKQFDYDKIRNIPGIGFFINVGEALSRFAHGEFREGLHDLVWAWGSIFGGKNTKFIENIMSGVDFVIDIGKSTTKPINKTPVVQFNNPKKFWDSLSKWYSNLLSYENLKNIPILRDIVKMGEMMAAIVDSPEVNNIKKFGETIGGKIGDSLCFVADMFSSQKPPPELIKPTTKTTKNPDKTIKTTIKEGMKNKFGDVANVGEGFDLINNGNVDEGIKKLSGFLSSETLNGFSYLTTTGANKTSQIAIDTKKVNIKNMIQDFGNNVSDTLSKTTKDTIAVYNGQLKNLKVKTEKLPELNINSINKNQEIPKINDYNKVIQPGISSYPRNNNEKLEKSVDNLSKSLIEMQSKYTNDLKEILNKTNEGLNKPPMVVSAPQQSMATLPPLEASGEGMRDPAYNLRMLTWDKLRGN